MNTRTKQLKTEPIGRLLFKLSLPATVGMVVMALYNIINAIYIGRGVGMLGIAAVAIGFPIQVLLMSISQTMGLGGGSIISIALGAKNPEKAHRVLGNVIVLTLILSVIISLVGHFYLEPILIAFGATPSILPYSKAYLSIILWANVFGLLGIALNNIVRSEGNAKVAMGTMLISAIMNAVLDPIFIFGFHMGLKGAAIATTISQGFILVYLTLYFLSSKSTLKLKWHHFVLKTSLVFEILTVGSGAFARQAAGGVMAVIINRQLGVYGGDVEIAAFGIVFRVLSFIMMPIFGISQGFMPIVGFNYGAKQMIRVKRAIRLAIYSATVISVVGFCALFLFPLVFIRMFTTQADLIERAATALRIMILATPMIGIQVIGASMFQALGKALHSLFLSLSRQVLFFIPLLWILPHFFHLTGIWIAFPVADVLAVLVTVWMMVAERKRLNQYLEPPPPLSPCVGFTNY